MTSWNENSVRPWRLIATHTYSPSSDRRKSYSVRRDPCKSFLRRLTDTPCFTRQSISTSSLQTATRKLLSRDSSLSLNSMGPTTAPTRTLGMRLSCNFVNVYTIVYHVQYTYTCTPAHPQRTSSRGKVRVGPVEFKLYSSAPVHCKISVDYVHGYLWRVFPILMEAVPYTFVSVNR